MLEFKHIHTITPDGKPLIQVVTDYIRKKDANFIVAQGSCVNLKASQLKKGQLEEWMTEFAACSFSRIIAPEQKPSPPFLAAGTDPDTGRAKVEFLIDLTQEAQTGKASKFYSKMMGALASHFFTAQPEVTRLGFPFCLEDTLGRGVVLETGDPGASGDFIVKAEK